jgi:hypothetical protein
MTSRTRALPMPWAAPIASRWFVRAAPRVEGLRVEQRCDLTQWGAVLAAATALTVTVPRVGWARPTVNPMVDLPAPLGRRKPVALPGCTANVTSSIAVLAAQPLVRP